MNETERIQEDMHRNDQFPSLGLDHPVLSSNEPAQCQYMFARKGYGSPVHQCTAKAKYGERFRWRHLKYRNMPIVDNHTRQTKRLTGPR